MRSAICFILGLLFLTIESRAGDFNGKVVGPDGKPVGGATVYLLKYSNVPAAGATRREMPTTRTDDAGEFHISNPDSGGGQLVAGADGFGLGIARTIDGHLEIRLTPRTDVTLTFETPDNKPAVGVPIYLSSLTVQLGGLYFGFGVSSEDRSPWSSVTDANGKCTIGGLPQGAQIGLAVGDSHYAQLTNRENVTLAASAQTAADPIRLVEGCTISGKVVDSASGQPVAGIVVNAQNNDGFGAHAATAADGSYTIGQLQPGQYDVELNLSDDQLKQWTGKAVENLNIAAGSAKDGVNFSLIPGVVLSGTVMAADDGKPVAGVPIGIYGPAHPRSGGQEQTVNTDASGSFSTRVPAGEQFVFVDSDTPADGFGRPSPDNKTITISDGGSGSVDFRLPRVLMSPVKGTVVDADGNPVSGASVYVSSDLLPMFQGVAITSNADGVFQSMPMQRVGRIEIRARYQDLGTSKPVIINRGSSGPVVVHLEKGALAMIAGRVVDPANQPLKGAHIELLVRMSRYSFGQDGGVTDDGGNFKIESLWADPIYYIEATGNGLGQSETNQLRVEPGQTLQVHDLVLYKRDSSVAGMLMDADGKPVAGQRVYVSGPKTGYNNVDTDSGGKFSCAVVSGDRLLIQFMRANGRGYSRQTAQAGDLNIVLHTAAPRIAAAPAVHVTVGGPAAAEAPGGAVSGPSAFDPAAAVTWEAWLAAGIFLAVGGIITAIAHAIAAMRGHRIA